MLWEHLVLEHLQAHLPGVPAHYWRDKQVHEIDFILPRRLDEADVIEGKWDAAAFDSTA